MKLIYSKELPFFFTVLVGLIAYQINEIAKIQTDSPLLAYQFRVLENSEKEKTDISKMECELSNLSRKESIRNIILHIAYKSDLPNPKIVRNPDIIAIAPSSIIPDTLYTSGYGINEYKIPVIQPNAKYSLMFETETNHQIDEYPKLYLTSDKNVRLVQTSLMTLIASNQLTVNLILLCLWVLFSILYLVFLLKNEHLDLNNEKN
ncbi:MAG: hypothetical protein AAGA64_13065 [Bacteroidota bacterium]